ncbi:phenylalanine--tRNA ligase subunit beta [Chromatiales bacterium (ex Bugula neritina AB1)]|nr:phenylalanine--tRNA ligase subunit beta [Chromatiales bacterium (ex Bugula neritina AB1)]
MKFSEAWVREWVNLSISSDELAEQLTMLGLEVDDRTPAAGKTDGVVVAEIQSAEQHPDADRLRVCKVDDGSGELHNVVCGAPNARAGIRVPFARVGAELSGGFKIKSTKLRGVKSDGMLCSAAELKLSEESDGLHELAADAPLGLPLSEYLSLDDYIIDIDLTPNRGDCLSLRGVARELSARNLVPLVEPQFDVVEQSHEETFPVEIAADTCCANYVGRVIKGIDPSASTPLWMVEKLRRCGIRSISPSVDVTNFVMMEFGQPMHAFDLAGLDQGIRVRPAEQGEKLTLLDGREITLDADTTLICDHNKAVAIAGIMGGDATGVSSQTQDVLLEAALFTPLGIAGKPRRYNAYTDSAQRFERGVDSALQHQAIERASQLLISIVGGSAGPVFETRNPELDRKMSTIHLRRARLDRFLGVVIDDQRVSDILNSLGIELNPVSDGWEALAPSYRYDIAIEEDLIEEIARVNGYDNMPRTNPPWVPRMGSTPEQQMPRNKLQQLLVDRGYQEVVCYSFVDGEKQQLLDPQAGALPLANPISSDMDVMRNSLWPGLCSTMQSNLNRQQNDIRLFESGLKFTVENDELKQQPVISGLVAGIRTPAHWSESEKAADFFDTKADVESLLAAASDRTFRFQKAEHAAMHPGICAAIYEGQNRVGWLGSLHPKLQKLLDLSQIPVLFEIELEVLNRIKLPEFSEISRFPSVRRDLAVTVDMDISYAAIEECVRKHAPSSLKEVRVIDVYTGKGITSGLKSVALGLILQDFSSTLGDNEIDTAMSRILNGLIEDLRATLRT